MRVRRYNCKAMTASETPGQSARQTSRGRPRQTASARALAAAAPSAPQPPASLWEDTAASEPLLPDSAPQSAIRDSLYDLIPLGALELDLIGTPEFVRLQGVKQLGFVYRVWPGATHTRFEHSLGVYYLMLLALRALRAQARDAVSADPTDLRTLLAAALLHDVGHYPFSHAIEELGYPIVPHEQVGARLITENALAEVLRRHGLEPARVAALADPPRDP